MNEPPLRCSPNSHSLKRHNHAIKLGQKVCTLPCVRFGKS